MCDINSGHYIRQVCVIATVVTIAGCHCRTHSHLLGSYLSFLLCRAMPYSDSALNMSCMEEMKALRSNPPPDSPVDGYSIENGHSMILIISLEGSERAAVTTIDCYCCL
jgi:hypothetical protein